MADERNKIGDKIKRQQQVPDSHPKQNPGGFRCTGIAQEKPVKIQLGTNARNKGEKFAVHKSLYEFRRFRQLLIPDNAFTKVLDYPALLCNDPIFP